MLSKLILKEVPRCRLRVCSRNLSSTTGTVNQQVQEKSSPVLGASPSVSFGYSDEQKELINLARKFADSEIIPNAAKWDRESIFPREQHQLAHELGFYSLGIPTEYGGLGMKLTDVALVHEQIAYGCTGFWTTLLVTELAMAPIHKFGTEAQKQKYMGRTATERIVAAYCVTEPNAGSDVASVKTKAVKNANGDWVLSGQKMWISNGGEADWYFVLARTNLDPCARPGEAFTGFVFDAKTAGVQPGRKEMNMGQRASDTRGISFDDVILGEDAVVGEVGQGFKVAMSAFDMSRPIVACGATGLAQRALDEATAYALNRKAFSQPISNFQAVQFMLANMAIGVETSRLAYLKATWLLDQGLSNTYEASIAKCLAADVANQNATDAVQIFGGAGFNSEYPVEKLFRDAKIFQIYEGTAQIQRVVIARQHLAKAKQNL